MIIACRSAGLVFASGLTAGLVSGELPHGHGLIPAEARPQASGAVISTRTPLAGAYRAQVLQVIDGDTIEARVHVWMGQEVVTRVRLAEIDAPELRGACPAEQQAADAARQRLMVLAGQGSLVLADIRPDKYFGRVTARLLDGEGQDLGARLLAEGLARPYRGGQRAGWCG